MSVSCLQNCDACPTRVVCRCLRVTETELVDTIQQLGLRTVKEVKQHTGAGDGCTCCHDEIRELLLDNQPLSAAG